MSAITAMSTDGVIAVDLHKGSVNGDIFNFIRGSLIPNMQQFDGVAERSILILDHCSIHHVPNVTEHFRDAGTVVIFLPLYSPDLSPIEELFSRISKGMTNYFRLMIILSPYSSSI